MRGGTFTGKWLGKAVSIAVVSFILLVCGTSESNENKHFVAEPGVLGKVAEVKTTIPGEMEDGEKQSMFPAVWCADISDEKTQEICWTAYQAGLKYYSTGLEHRTRIFRWQHLSTRIIFFIVNGLVLIGLYFAWVQFKQDMLAGSEGHAKEANEVELTTSGIKVRSSVLGVIILALSLAFFYLYLVFVYPIQEIF